jgi:RNA polymerase sigma-70 factor (ECF subfamily)
MPPTPPDLNDPALLAEMKVIVRAHLAGIVRLRAYLDSDDVLQNVLMRLMGAMGKVRPSTRGELLGLAARHIRWEVIDLYRTHFGPEGPGKKLEPLSGAALDLAVEQPADDGTAAALAAAQLAEAVDKLPKDLREVVDLLFYHHLTHEQAAEVLGVSTKTIQRAWRDAKVKLGRALR